MTTEEQFEAIIVCLQEASDAGSWAFWRSRFNSNHPEHVQREEIENPEQYAKANFYAAKHVYCNNMEELDKLYATRMAQPVPVNAPQYALFRAMVQVVKDEMDSKMEEVLTKESY